MPTNPSPSQPRSSGWLFHPRESPAVLLTTLLALSTLAIAWALLFPFDFQTHRQTPWLSGWHIPKLNSIGNILLFMPFGAATTWLVKQRFPRLAPPWRTLVILITAAALSLFGETLQTWLPKRYSSVIDALANILGAAVGIGFARLFESKLTAAWSNLLTWSSRHPSGRRAIWAVLLLILIKTAPFDASPETFYLKEQLIHTWDAGLPFSTLTTCWHTPHPDPQLAAAATHQLLAALANLLLLAAVTFAIGRPLHHAIRRSGTQSYPLLALAFVGLTLALAVEFLQWPVRSRLMDATDAASGLLGALLGALASWITHLLTPPRQPHP